MHFLCYLSVGGGFWSAQKIAELRAQSGFALGSGQHVHCNAAGASPSPDPVLRVLTSHLNSEAAVGGYAAASFAASSLDSTYLSIESLVNAPPSSVALHDSSTTSFTHGIHSIPLSSESVIVSCSSAEYASNAIAIMKHSRDKGGLEPIFLTNVVGGGVDMEALERELTKPGRRVAAVVLTHAPTNGGLINNAEGIGEMISRMPDPPLFLLDACQTVGQVPLDVKKIKVDLMAGTSRKWLRGPRGVGFLYVNPSAALLEPPMLDLRGAVWIRDEETSRWAYEVDETARRYEFWEGSIANKLAFGRAVDIARELGVENIRERVKGLAETTRSLVEREVGLTCMDVEDGDVKELSGICSFDASPLGGADRAVEEMLKIGISLSATGTLSTLHDATERDLPEKILRLSPHYFNTQEDIDKVVEGLLYVKSRNK